MRPTWGPAPCSIPTSPSFDSPPPQLIARSPPPNFSRVKLDRPTRKNSEYVHHPAAAHLAAPHSPRPPGRALSLAFPPPSPVLIHSSLNLSLGLDLVLEQASGLASKPFIQPKRGGREEAACSAAAGCLGGGGQGRRGWERRVGEGTEQATG